MINYSLDSTPELSSGLCYYYQLMVSHRFEKQRKLQLHKSGPRIIKDREERWASYAALITLEKRKPADRGSADGVKCQLFTAPKTPTYSLFPLLLSVSSHPFSRPKRGPLLRTAFSLLSHSHLSSFYIVYPLCPSSVLAFISPSVPAPHPTPPYRRSVLLPQPLFLSLSPVEEVPGQCNWYSGSVRANAEPC